uniref:Uncharacterized protein n=1 Tax=Arundo donax TaxID=35708 RepID=A0A0A9A186_ARUDO
MILHPRHKQWGESLHMNGSLL